MNLRYILAAIIAIGAIIVGVSWASSRGHIDLPDWIPGTEEIVFINSMDVKLSTRGWSWESDSIEILDHTIVLDQKTVGLSIGPLFIGSRTIRGEFIVEILKDGHLIDSESRNYEITEEFWEFGKSKTFTLNNLRLGPPDSGRYEIRASMYDADGNLVDRESVWRTI